jgi:hypothetical protein
LGRLQVPQKERAHEQNGWENEKQLDDGNGLFNRFHIYFVTQSNNYVKRLLLTIYQIKLGQQEIINTLQ